MYWVYETSIACVGVVARCLELASQSDVDLTRIRAWSLSFIPLEIGTKDGFTNRAGMAANVLP